jgi:murein DD-endopeptidase MepM/ murein hydrolase activator NlpD
MSRRQWTLLLVSDNETKVRQYHFSREMVRLGVALALVTVSALSSLGTAIVVKHRAPRQTAELTQRNDLLKTEIQDIQKQLTSLDVHLDNLAQQDEQFRLVAGLEPIDRDVQRVGIGGPDGENAEASRLLKLDRGASELATTTSHQVSELLRRARLLSFSWREATNTLETKHDRLLATPSIVPTEGFLTSAFSHNRMHPIFNRARPHQGVDITAKVGTPIVAAAKGTVISAGYEGDYGFMVELDHGYGVITRYAHASKTLVRRGQVVERGENIALVGSTGLSVGPHLHYEVLVNGRPTNPRKFFFDNSVVAD